METLEFISTYLSKNRIKIVMTVIMAAFALTFIIITLGFGVYKISIAEAQAWHYAVS